MKNRTAHYPLDDVKEAFRCYNYTPSNYARSEMEYNDLTHDELVDCVEGLCGDDFIECRPDDRDGVTPVDIYKFIRGDGVRWYFKFKQRFPSGRWFFVISLHPDW